MSPNQPTNQPNQTMTDFEPKPTPAAVIPTLQPGQRVRFTSGRWRRNGANDWHPYDGEGVIISAPTYGSLILEYVSPQGVAVRACYTTGWTCFEPIG